MRNLLILLAALLFASACGPTSTITTPSSFVALSEDSLRWKPYHYKAVSPDGAVIVIPRTRQFGAPRDPGLLDRSASPSG